MPPQRRPKGSGGLSQRKSDGMWIGRVDFGYRQDGTRNRRTVSSKSKAEATRKLRELNRLKASGHTGDTDARATVKAWADEWLPMHQREVRPNVFVTDRGVIRRWIVPTLGPRRLADLTPGDVRRLHDAVTKKGRSSTTARNVHAVFVTMLKAARLEGHPIPGRVFDVKRPRAAVSNRESIPVDQALALLEVIGQRPDSSRWLVGMLYGMRQAERLGLTWECVDLDAAGMSVEWQLNSFPADAKVPTWLRTRHLVGRYWLVETKTAKGERWLALLPIVAASLAAHRATSPPNPYGLVWADDGEPITTPHDRKAWREVQAAAGVAHPSGRPWLLHECRHTVISMLVADGVDRSIIAAIVGHSALVESYVHVDREAVRKALAGMAARWQIEG